MSSSSSSSFSEGHSAGEQVSVELEVYSSRGGDGGDGGAFHADATTPRVMFEDLSYSVTSSKGVPCRRRHTTKLLLRGVSGYLRAGEVTAIMGSSGAGKTTLLDLLAKRKTGGHVEGRILYDGTQRQHLSNVDAGYVLQSDYAPPTLTVREVLVYAARLRLPRSTPVQEREEKVDVGVVVAWFWLPKQSSFAH
jgi:ABC-type glutathione transport system ATPase component